MTAPDTRPPADDRGPSGAPAGCDCIELTNKALAEHNTELGLNFQIDRQTGGITTYIALQTVIVEKRRGARPIEILPTFCPFCGNRYETDSDAAQAPGAEGEAQS